jgi:hypothetical protein
MEFSSKDWKSLEAFEKVLIGEGVLAGPAWEVVEGGGLGYKAWDSALLDGFDRFGNDSDTLANKLMELTGGKG